jgi:basic amino acid/polyamine antiporter, APA family
VARLSEEGLRRTVGVPGLFATAYGNVGSSIYYALGLVAAHALGLTPVVFMAAGALFALTAKTYAEGAAMFPEAGGSSSFARHAFNEVASFVAGWALMLDYIITIAISAFFVPHYLAAFWPALRHPPGDVVGGIGVIALLAALNVRGLGESAKLNFVLAIADLATQVVLVVVGFVLVLNPGLLVNQVHLGTSPSWSQLIFALSVAMVAYTGIETVSNMAEEATDPGRDVPRAVNLVLIAVLAVYGGISVVALSALPVHHRTTELGTTYQADPVLGIVSALRLAPHVAVAVRAYVGALAATILLIATNAGLIGISRLSWSLAQHRQLPAIFARLHSRHQTPWFTIVAFSVLAGILLIPGKTDFLGNLYAFGAMLAFTTAHLAIIALRYRDPDRERPYRMPWNVRVRGGELPLTAVLGALGTFVAWLSVIALHAEARSVGTAWMVVGLGGYFIYRRRLGLNPREQFHVERRARPVDFHPLEYASALVPVVRQRRDRGRARESLQTHRTRCSARRRGREPHTAHAGDRCRTARARGTHALAARRSARHCTQSRPSESPHERNPHPQRRRHHRRTRRATRLRDDLPGDRSRAARTATPRTAGLLPAEATAVPHHHRDKSRRRRRRLARAGAPAGLNLIRPRSGRAVAKTCQGSGPTVRWVCVVGERVRLRCASP